MVLKEDKERVKVLLIEAIRALCKSGLKHEGEFCVEGLLGITLNQDDVFLVNINETIRNENASFHSNSTNSMPDNDELDDSPNQYAHHFFHSNMNNTPRDKKPYDAPKSGNGSNDAVDDEDYKVKGRKHLGIKQASQSQLANAIEDIIDSANNQEMHLEVPPKKRALEHHFSNDRPLGISLDTSDNNMFDDSDDDCDDDEDQESIPPQQQTTSKENCNSPVTDTGGDDGEEEKDEKDNDIQAHNSQMMQSWEQQQPSTSSAAESDKPENHVQASQLPRMHEIWLQQMLKMRQMSFYSNPMASLPTSPTSFEHQYRLAQQAVNLSASLGFQGQFQGHTPARSRMKSDTTKVKVEEGEDFTPQRVTVFKCPQCGKTYSSDRAYKDHARKHKGEYYLHCPICGKGFLCRRDLKGHMSNKHASEKEYKCHLCTKQFGYHQSYRNHMKFVHKIG